MVKGPKPALILGGGVAGLTAAQELSRNGIPVVLVEREWTLGGHAARWACMATDRCLKCSSCLVMDAKRDVLQDPRIRIVTLATLESASRQNGTIQVLVSPIAVAGGDDKTERNGPEGETLSEKAAWEVDALFLATGFEPFPAQTKPMLRCGELKSVLSTVDLDQVLREDRLGSLPVAADREPRVAFLQCIGSRDREAGRDYCSQVCCKTSLRMAARILHEKPEWQLTVFYIDLQVMGKGFRQFYRSLEGRVRFVQGVPSEVLEVENGQAALVYEDPLQGMVRTETFGLVVLAVGMVPGRDAPGLAGLLDLELEKRGFLQRVQGEQDSRLYSFGACCAPTDIQGARRQAMAAVGRYLSLRRSA